MRADQITEPLCYHGEGPVWWARTGELRWLDMLAHEGRSAGWLARTESGQTRRTDVDGPVLAVMRPRRGGGGVFATEHDVWLSDADDLADPRHLGTPVQDPNLRFNEGGCDPAGRFYAGTMSYDRAPGLASYLRFDDATANPAVVIEATSTSNGLGWSPDGGRVYFNDTPTHRVDLFDYVDGELRNRRPFVDLAGIDGRPDGLTVDAEGGVWVALIGQGKIHRYDATGALTEVVELAASRVTSCTFGGADLGTLYCTTSREKAEPGEEGAAGALFACRPGVVGLPVIECAW